MIETARLLLRPLEPRDRAAMWAQYRDPAVMRYLLPVADDAAHDAMAARLAGYLQTHGFTFWAVERRGDGAVIGTCGLKPGVADTPIAGMVEIGWRLARDAWGRATRGRRRRRCSTGPGPTPPPTASSRSPCPTMRRAGG